MKKRGEGMQNIGDILKNGSAHLRPPTPKQMRLIESAVKIREGQDDEHIAYHHTIFCQTALPYRQSDERVMERSNGHIQLRIEAGTGNDPITKKWVPLPLPFGVKSRLILIHFDTLAILNQSPEFEVEHSMTAFLKKIQGYAPNGKELKDFKQHATALTGALFRFATSEGNRTIQTDTKVITTFDLWYPKDERQGMLYTSNVRMSDEYFRTLKDHAVPLDYRAVSVLKESALALDIYKWLAQRLCRVSATRPAFIPWPILELQFGHSYKRIRDFRDAFKKALAHVQSQYEGARTGAIADERGLTLHLSRPPIEKIDAATRQRLLG